MLDDEGENVLGVRKFISIVIGCKLLVIFGYIVLWWLFRWG